MKFAKMKYFRYDLKLLLLINLSILLRYCKTQAPAPPIEQTQILWSLAPCQSAFWVPSTSSEFNQNWVTYQYEGNPLSQFGECLFTLESDPNTKIEIIIQQVQLFGNGATIPPPCLLLYDVKMDGSVVLLKKECDIILAFNEFESFSTFTETNLAVISTTIRYGSFQLRARAVPKNFGFPTKVSPTTPPTSPAVETSTFVPFSTPSSTPFVMTVTPSVSTSTATHTPENPGSPISTTTPRTRFFQQNG